MADEMTDERLAEIRQRADAATAGPWHTEYGLVWAEGKENVYQGGEGREYIATGEGGWSVGEFAEDDAEFVAHARADVPALLDEVERLREEIERQAADELTRMRYHDEEIARLREQVEALQAERLIEYGVVRPASMPDMSGAQQWVQIVGATFRSLEAAQTAQKNIPRLRDRDAVIVQRVAPGPWLPVTEEGPTP